MTKIFVVVIVNMGMIEEVKAFYSKFEADAYFKVQKSHRKMGEASGIQEVVLQ